MSTQFERSSATRAKIIEVARAAFLPDGYGGTSLDKIAAAAGVTKGALYHHYASKKALFTASCAWCLDRHSRLRARAFATSPIRARNFRLQQRRGWRR